MRLLKMRPEELQDAVARGLPLLMAAGVVEYHGPHLPLGTDILITESLVDEIERRCECVIAPSLPYGPTMNWAGGPEEGDMDFPPEPFYQYVKESFRGLLSFGFKRIYVVHHHAGPEGLQALCLKRAAAELIRDTGKSWGAGWGRWEQHDLPHPDIFGIIKVAGLDAFSVYPSQEAERHQLGHASRGETEWLMAVSPDTVRLDLLPQDPGSRFPWLRDSHLAAAEEGKRWIDFCAQGWEAELSGRSKRN